MTGGRQVSTSMNNSINSCDSNENLNINENIDIKNEMIMNENVKNTSANISCNKNQLTRNCGETQDNEEVNGDRETPDTDKESNNNDDSDTESGGSGSDSESSVDEEECEKRKLNFFSEMADLERQFHAIREQLYLERIAQIDRKLEEIRAEQSYDYHQPLEELQENVRIRTEVAGILRQLKLNNVQCQHDAELLAAKQHFESEVKLLKEQIGQELDDKLRRLEEDRNSIDSEFWPDGGCLAKKRKKYGSNSTNGYEYGPGRDQLNLPDRRRKPVSVSGPYIVYMLKENEILEDWAFIRKASRSSSSMICY